MFFLFCNANFISFYRLERQNGREYEKEREPVVGGAENGREGSSFHHLSESSLNACNRQDRSRPEPGTRNSHPGIPPVTVQEVEASYLSIIH